MSKKPKIGPGGGQIERPIKGGRGMDRKGPYIRPPPPPPPPPEPEP